MPLAQRSPLPTFLYGTAWKEDRTAALTELAIRTGFRGIDTANQRRHYFEAGVGQALAASYRAGVVSRQDLFLQNGVFARLGWDRAVRLFCRELNITYQGFSLLTANLEVLEHPVVTSLAARANATAAQIVFCFAREAGMLPITGTSNAEHMQQ